MEVFVLTFQSDHCKRLFFTGNFRDELIERLAVFVRSKHGTDNLAKGNTKPT